MCDPSLDPEYIKKKRKEKRRYKDNLGTTGEKRIQILH